ncbi:low temperature requirement protein A [Yinghuangia sp. YIM S10712]|uniref:low temperature requirement protein A n=1 Tax=Yinghuangia sp. YIM S10712 TaxID=3436930 RepID=UPI003F53DF48
MPGERARPRLTATTDEHRVTPAELFFDLVFVFAITQVTALMAENTSALRMLGAVVVLALLWWCWCCFAWLGNVVRADTGALLGVLVSVMAAVLVVTLAVPQVYSDHDTGFPVPLVFVLCYGAVRVLHLVAYWLSAPGDAELRATIRRAALLSVSPPFVLLLVGAALDGAAQIILWLAAVLVDYGAIYVIGASGWRVTSPAHFAERHGLIVIIALGESLMAIGAGVAGLPLNAPVLVTAAAALLLAVALWRVYFRRVAEAAEHRLTEAREERTGFARDVYTFLHLPLVAGIVLAALGIKKVAHQVADDSHYELSEPLHGIVAWSLTGGVGLFLLGACAILWRTTGRRPTTLLVSGVASVAAGGLVVLLPALVSLVLLSAGTATLALTYRQRNPVVLAPAES